MSDPCGACAEAATNPYACVYWAGCRQCEVRMVADTFPRSRQKFLDALGAMKGDAARQAFCADLEIERLRVEKLKASA